MRKFIVSDLHGDGNVYHSIISYLENINKKEPVTLYIDGDLIDRGLESAEMLLDVRDRIVNKKSFPIEYLAGNHEQVMYYVLTNKPWYYEYDAKSTWQEHGGNITLCGLEEYYPDKDKLGEVLDFVGDLRLYHRFDEKLHDRPLLLVHAGCPSEVEDECKLTIKDGHPNDIPALWARETSKNKQFRLPVGHPKFFSIVGHTPNDSRYGYKYNAKQEYLNIDGGCSRYVSGLFDINHVPLVEVKPGYVRIIVFNNSNQIIHGCYFDGNYTIPICPAELDEDRELLDKDFKPKRLVITNDEQRTVMYEDMV